MTRAAPPPARRCAAPGRLRRRRRRPRVVATTTQVADLARNVGRRPHDGQPDPHAQRRPARLRAARPRRQARSRARSSCCAPAARSTSGSRRRRPAPARTRRVVTLGEDTRRGAALVAGPARGDRRGGEDPRRAGRGRPGRPRGLRGQRAALHARGCARSTARSPAASPRSRAAQRKLVTTHDALGSYAHRYGLEVDRHRDPVALDARPGVGGRDRRARARRSGASGVPAVFAESSVNADVEEAIAREAGAQVSPPLWADSLGPKGSPARPTSTRCEANTRTIVDGARRRRRAAAP